MAFWERPVFETTHGSSNVQSWSLEASKAAKWQLYQGRPAAMAVSSTMAALSRLRTRPVAAMAALSIRSGSEQCKAGGSWTPTAMANPRRRTRALRYFGAGVWPVGLPETIFRAKLPRQPWQTRAVARARSVYFGAGGLARGASRNKFPSDAKRGDLAGRREAYVATRAAQIIKRTNGQISSFGLRMADFILSRIRSLSAARPSHF